MGEQRVRIVAGEFKGHPIAAPKGRSTRPTADRVREGLFSALTSRLGSDLGGGPVLDAFAGSGALGLEALSRGAIRATFVEKSRSAARALRANVASLPVRDRTAIVDGDVRVAAKRGRLPGAPFSLLFLDPPYRIEQSEVRAVIEALLCTESLAEGAIVVWEHDANDSTQWPSWIEQSFELTYGTTRIDAGVYARGDAT